MAARRGEDSIQRFNVRLPEPDAAWVTAHAAASGKSAPAVIADAVAVVRLQHCSDTDQDAADVLVLLSPRYQAVVRERDREREEFARRLVAVRRQPDNDPKGAGNEAEKEPRWAWPLDRLLGDQCWWERWLPRLYELMGRDAPLGAERRPTDGRGYVELMELLFPPAGGVSWRSLEYPAAAQAEHAANGSQPATIFDRWEERAQVWEPVVRHVAVALAALETTGRGGVDALHVIEVGAEIVGPWHDALRRLLGLTWAELPGTSRG